MTNQKRYLVHLDIYDESLLSLVHEVSFSDGVFACEVDDVSDEQQLINSIVDTYCSNESAEENFTATEVKRIVDEITHADTNLDELAVNGYTKAVSGKDALVMIIDKQHELKTKGKIDLIDATH